MKAIIFDLDHTVIDSSHRKLTRPDGSLDLAHWLENCTREKIFADTLMPLAEHWKSLQGQIPVYICTARQMQQHDWDYLAHHGLNFDRAFYRAEGDNRADHEMKYALLAEYFNGSPVAHPTEYVMWDDNDAVRETLASRLQMTTLHPDEFSG